MNNAPIYRIVFIAVLGGFLFGLNMAGISGAVNSIKELFSLTDNGIWKWGGGNCWRRSTASVPPRISVEFPSFLRLPISWLDTPGAG